jgi:hypothetical protein
MVPSITVRLPPVDRPDAFTSRPRPGTPSPGPTTYPRVTGWSGTAASLEQFRRLSARYIALPARTGLPSPSCCVVSACIQTSLTTALVSRPSRRPDLYPPWSGGSCCPEPSAAVVRCRQVGGQPWRSVHLLDGKAAWAVRPLARAEPPWSLSSDGVQPGLPRAVTREAPRLRLAREHRHSRRRINASVAAVMAVQAYELAKVGSNQCCGTG